MAFLESVGKAIGKASQGLSDAKETISNAAQETRDNIARERQEKQIQKEAKRLLEQEEQAMEERKCPHCGNPLSGISAVCPMCGYEVKVGKASKSISELTREIDKLERKRNAVTDALAAKLSGRGNPTDEKIASLIRNFVVPNNKSDIFEFMILAAGYMDAKVLAGKRAASEISEVVIKAWQSKFEQTFQKAQFAFGNDTDFKKIEDIYYGKIMEIESERPFVFFRRK